jgi:hypothetical protein
MSSLSLKEKHLLISRIKFRAISLVGLAFIIVMPAYAERKYTLGTSFDVVAGMSNMTFQLHPFYSIYPSIQLDSVGPHSTLELGYTFVGQRFQVSPVVTNASHVFTGNFVAQVTKKIHLSLSDELNTSPDYLTVNVLKGFTPNPEGFKYIYEPQFYKQSNISNYANGSLDLDLSSKSYLTFEASGSFRFYREDIAIAQLPDQVRMEERLSFSHRHSKRLTWSVSYVVWQNHYRNSERIRTHSTTVGLSRELSPGFNITMEAGPSYTEEGISQKAYIGYLASARIIRQRQTNRFSAGYLHRSGDSTGLESTTESHQGALAFSQTISRTITVNLDALAFSQSQRSTNVYDYWGANGSIAILWQLGRYWVASVGGNYIINEGRSVNYDSYASKQLFVAFGYRLPEFWKTER